LRWIKVRLKAGFPNLNSVFSREQRRHVTWIKQIGWSDWHTRSPGSSSS
jgi:hypothetical protein